MAHRTLPVFIFLYSRLIDFLVCKWNELTGNDYIFDVYPGLVFVYHLTRMIQSCKISTAVFFLRLELKPQIWSTHDL